MAIPQPYRTNFNTLLSAAKADDLALVECKDAVTKEPRYVICAIGYDGREYVITPFGHLCMSNPFEAYVDPIQSMDMDKE